MTTLEQVLLNTLNKEEPVRKAAEKALHEACVHQGYVLQLLKISCEATNPKEVRQAASIALKNGIKRNWSTPEEDLKHQQKADGASDFSTFVIPVQDRDMVRASILQGLSMVRSDNESLRRVLAECVGLIAEKDYPQRWPQFIPEIVAMLSNVNDRDCIHNALLAIRRVVKSYEYKRRPRKSKSDAERKLKNMLNGTPGAAEGEFEVNKREPLDVLVQATFPIMLSYGKQFVTMDDDVFGFLLRIIAKIFYSASRLELPPHLQSPQVMAEWCQLWEQTILKRLSVQQSEGDDIDDLSLRPWWKCKKAALEIVVRVFQESVKDPKFISDDDAVTRAFTDFYVNGGVATTFLLCCFKLLEEWARNNKPTPSRVLQLCLNYCAISLEPAKTYKGIKPHLQFLIDEVVLKALAFTEKDQQEWNDEPETYAAHDLAPLEDMFDLKATAAHLLLEACSKRSKDVLDGLVTYLVQQLSKRPSAAKQDAALFAVGTLAEILCPYQAKDADGELIVRKASKRAEKYKTSLEMMISSYVVPELNAPEPHVRARACWVVGRYAHVDWKEVAVAQKTFGGLLDRLGDAHLPVQSQAASSLRAVLVLDPENNLAARALREIAINHLPLIVEKYLVIMSKVGADDVVAGLQALIDAFHNEIAPMAAEICRALVQAFFHYSGADEEDDQEGLKASAAFETLDAINSLMECAATSVDKTLISRMESVVLPLLVEVINPKAEIADYLDPVVTTYSFLTYYAPVPLSNEVWSFVGRIKHTFDEYAFDNLQDFIVPLEHLAKREPQRFFLGSDEQNPGMTYAQCCFEMCRKVMEDTEGEYGAGEQDIRIASSLLCAILQAAPSEAQVPFVEACCRQASYWLFFQTHTDLTRSTRARLFEVIESCLYIAPVRTRGVFAQNLLPGLIKLRDSLPSHTKIRSKKVAVLGLASLIGVLPSTDGDTGQECLALATAQCAELLANIRAQKEFEENGEADDEDEEDAEIEDDDENDEEEEEADEDEDAVDDIEENYKNFVKAHGEMPAWGMLDGADYDEGEEEDEEEDELPWALNAIDETQAFQIAVRRGMNERPQLFRSALVGLSDSVKQALVEFVPELLPVIAN